MALKSNDEIKDLAPDRRAFAAAKKTASASKWSTLGQQGNILWGKAVGSDGSQYSVYVDVDDNALECSCPSRKRPCKHALGLLLLESGGHEIPDAPVPSGHKYEAQDRYYSTWE